jgi:hypothetical protein
MGIMDLFVALTETLSCEIEGPRPEHSRPTGQEIVWRHLVAAGAAGAAGDRRGRGGSTCDTHRCGSSA